mmetsp:Transcript_9082/g.12167  ORF Transcript_9082/g.12167 Transcript_9082/m.12167 type:complete len:849 (-) Transcript_9082:50-2596(-)
MGEFLRSLPMRLVQLVIPFDVAHDTVDELGRLGAVQFKDMNPHLTAPQRAFVNDVKRIDELERKLRFVHAQAKRFYVKYERDDGFNLYSLNVSIDADCRLDGHGVSSLSELEAELEDIERSVVELNEGEEGLRRHISETSEKRSVLEIVHKIFQGSGEREEESPQQMVQSHSSLTMIMGAIPLQNAAVFQRVIWRVTRGNMFIRMEDIPDSLPSSNPDESVMKSAFLILTQSVIASDKIKKLCESFGANVYDCPDSAEARQNEVLALRGRENDLQVVLDQNARGSEQIYSRVSSRFDAWRVRILKEKSIYHTLNLFRYNLGGKTLIAEGWVPMADLERVGAATQRATQRSGSMLPVVMKPIEDTHEVPPTYFKTNKFTWAHQEIVDAYGIARYQEINPTVFSIITFPFLFGVMFGDVGHGLLMLIFVLFLLWKEEEFSQGGLNEMLQTLFDGRYIILLMSLFSIYNGFLYNEFFSIPMAPGGLFEVSMWQINQETPSLTLVLNNDSYVYPFGVDPTWKGAVNELYYYNSLKMKMSVLLGVSQMLLGISLSGMNAVYRKKMYDIFFEFVPQIIFMITIFGYLCILILVKWCLQWDNVLENDPQSLGREIPSLLSTLVNMFLSPASLAAGGASEQDRIWSSQMAVQIFLLLLALICVPWMLLPKPLLLKRDHEAKQANVQKKKKKKSYLRVSADSDDESDGFGDVEVVGEEFDDHDTGAHAHEEEEFEFQEILIHQVIHTIEFVLGAISNTASYLRLWALSLAHSELSTVFWEKIVIATLTMGNPFALFVGFGAWAALSFAVLMVMESLSAFLHALRLHWVEFMNKFYGGDGYKFIPFSYDRILSGQDDN